MSRVRDCGSSTVILFASQPPTKHLHPPPVSGLESARTTALAYQQARRASAVRGSPSQSGRESWGDKARYHGWPTPFIRLLPFGFAEEALFIAPRGLRCRQTSIAMADIDEKRDLEASYEKTHVSAENIGATDVDEGYLNEVKRSKELQHNIPFFRYLRAGEEWLDAKMGVELQGIDRIPEEKKNPPSIWNVSAVSVSVYTRR